MVAGLAINPNTVLKAYRELENKGLAAGRPGQGTFVQATLSQVALPELGTLRRTLLGWLASADASGLDEDGVVALHSVLRDFFKTQGGAAAATVLLTAERRASHERHRNHRAGQTLRGQLGAARLHAGAAAGHLAALVGPNGAGKTTLMNMTVGLAVPTAGTVSVLGGQPAGSAAALDGIAFVGQDAPLYKNLSVRDMLHLTRNLNRNFDQKYARSRLADLDIPLGKKAGRLSGGQQAQLALTLALARRPQCSSWTSRWPCSTRWPGRTSWPPC